MIKVSILIPIIGYVGLWILGIALFLAYFRLFNIGIDLKHTVSMIRKLPAFLAIATVPLCSFLSFFVTTKVVLGAYALSLDTTGLLQLGVISLLCTVVLDLMITVVGERIDIRVFPINLMYLTAWLVIVPAVVLAGQ